MNRGFDDRKDRQKRNFGTTNRKAGKMKISMIKLAWKFVFGGGAAGVVEYALGVLRDGLAGLGDTTREKVQGALNLALRVLSVLEAVRILVPTKWQTAYAATLEAVRVTVAALEDLDITRDELDVIVDRVTAAYDAWRGEDDETCVDPERHG